MSILVAVEYKLTVNSEVITCVPVIVPETMAVYTSLTLACVCLCTGCSVYGAGCQEEGRYTHNWASALKGG